MAPTSAYRSRFFCGKSAKNRNPDFEPEMILFYLSFSQRYWVKNLNKRSRKYHWFCIGGVSDTTDKDKKMSSIISGVSNTADAISMVSQTELKQIGQRWLNYELLKNTVLSLLKRRCFIYYERITPALLTKIENIHLYLTLNWVTDISETGEFRSFLNIVVTTINYLKWS